MNKMNTLKMYVTNRKIRTKKQLAKANCPGE
ncbi:hypothetical protein C621_0228815 [Bacillus thuringiensis serovar aizawai str. Leapi01]|nr:hypothetical protein C621_0228815 [Bacillus thuringiensis serovar aizawai str. Leapi01]ETE98557.1 hypothetical protein C623_0208725 [Bacillus thuringiensis serovar aizawai str. Hu4-2]